MSAFVLVLAAGMAVGNGPEAVSAETELELDLRGRWEGTIPSWRVGGPTMQIWVYKGAILNSFFPHDVTRVVKEGEGKVRLILSGSDFPDICSSIPGIYEWEGDRLIICTSIFGVRPRSFHASMFTGQTLYILHRVQPDR
jgi:hypothetical protein